MPRYGFIMIGGAQWHGNADTLREAIAIAERDKGGIVQCGRCLDNYERPATLPVTRLGWKP